MFLLERQTSENYKFYFKKLGTGVFKSLVWQRKMLNAISNVTKTLISNYLRQLSGRM
jgi:hypothetical protein